MKLNSTKSFGLSSRNILSLIRRDRLYKSLWFKSICKHPAINTIIITFYQLNLYSFKTPQRRNKSIWQHRFPYRRPLTWNVLICGKVNQLPKKASLDTF
jgi:hypothetical protein